MAVANMGIDLAELEVSVEAAWDPRGTLAMGKEIPSGISFVGAHRRLVVHRRTRRGLALARLVG